MSSFIPKIAKDTNPRFLEHLRNRSEEMIGKTIKEVSCGMREHEAGVHESQVLVIKFTDDTILYIQTASNAMNIVQDVRSGDTSKLTESDFHADLFLTWHDPNEE